MYVCMYVRIYIIKISIECEKVVENTSERTLASSLATGNDQTASKKDSPPSSGMYSYKLRHGSCTQMYCIICDRVCEINHLVAQKSPSFFKHIFHNLCSIYTSKLNVLPQMQN